ncbi:MAG: F0F1 ATP synthase subunit delta [Anaerolineae bacterium]
MLELDLATIVFQVINFIVLAIVLNRFLFQPILRQAAQRAEERERLTKEIAEERQRVATLRAELEQRQMKLDEEADKILAKARERAEAESQELLQQARAEVEQMLVEAQVDVHRLKQQAIDQFHEQLVDAILEISANITARIAPLEVQDALINGLVEHIREMGRTEMDRVDAIRRSLSTREPIAYVSSARELSAEQQGQLARILTALADRNVNIQLTIEPDLVAGIRVRLGDMVMDNSLAGQLQELRAHVSTALREQVENA